MRGSTKNLANPRRGPHWLSSFCTIITTLLLAVSSHTLSQEMLACDKVNPNIANATAFMTQTTTVCFCILVAQPDLCEHRLSFVPPADLYGHNLLLWWLKENYIAIAFSFDVWASLWPKPSCSLARTAETTYGYESWLSNNCHSSLSQRT